MRCEDDTFEVMSRCVAVVAYVNLGAALISAGRCQEAVSVLRQGSRLDGTGLRDRREHETARVSALLQLGALYSDQGRLQRALAAYREAAYSLPEHYPPQMIRAEDAVSAGHHLAAVLAQMGLPSANSNCFSYLNKHDIVEIDTASTNIASFSAETTKHNEPPLFLKIELHYCRCSFFLRRLYHPRLNPIKNLLLLAGSSSRFNFHPTWKKIVDATKMMLTPRYLTWFVLGCVFNVLGETLARLHQDEEAERWYQAALNAQPDHVPAHITYGKLLAKNVSRTAEAEQWFRKAQRLAPQEPSVYHHYVLLRNNKKEQRVNAAERSQCLFVH
ncbi:hypothetical protein GEV33_006466 [Tenebrio molitor]|uniref:Uncharacterized protein n=1 Tax=Tenebrio molitor TaxID=7067 RepID=A0A8J6HCK7_TENMO|nr:hypothetical protein GEV33_006466 [Tenebrio molitor]